MPDTVTAAPFSVKLALVATLLRVGAASSGVMLMVVVWTGLEPSDSSLYNFDRPLAANSLSQCVEQAYVVDTAVELMENPFGAVVE